MAQIEDDMHEMQRWLAQGLGRAVLHLETHASAPYRDLILHACLMARALMPRTSLLARHICARSRFNPC